ncbi:protein of unknown function [Magnetospira sp. QH-2]|nr:protein of unknown function [Magnetospira sp. QH-2]
MSAPPVRFNGKSVALASHIRYDKYEGSVQFASKREEFQQDNKESFSMKWPVKVVVGSR